MFIRRLIFNNF